MSDYSIGDHAPAPSCKATKLAEKFAKLDSSGMHRFIYWLMAASPKKSLYLKEVIETCENSLQWERQRRLNGSSEGGAGRPR